MTKDELQEIADMYGLYTEQDVENRLSCELLGIGTRNEELERENAELKQQIEKMKCCYNCSKDCGSIDRRICFENKMKDWVMKGAEND